MKKMTQTVRDSEFAVSMTVDEVVNNVEYLSDIFKKHGLIAFKNLNATEDEQYFILSKFGDALGWVPNSKIIEEDKDYTIRNWLRYDEDHSFSISLQEKNGQNPVDSRILINWHLEHIENSVAQIGAAWNMLKNSVDGNVFGRLQGGATGFIDCRKVFDRLGDGHKEFLKSATIMCVESQEYSMGWDCQPNPAAKRHFCTDRFVARICASGHYQKVISVNGLEANNEHQETMNEIREIFLDRVWFNEDDKIWWEWKQGDMLIPDLDVMAHCVLGGFTSQQRRFIGYWAFGENYKERMTPGIFT